MERITSMAAFRGSEDIDPGNKSDHDIYWACVNHNKMLLGITA